MGNICETTSWITSAQHFFPQKDPKTEFGHFGRCCWLVVWNIFWGGGIIIPSRLLCEADFLRCIRMYAEGAMERPCVTRISARSRPGFGIRTVVFLGPVSDTPCFTKKPNFGVNFGVSWSPKRSHQFKEKLALSPHRLWPSASFFFKMFAECHFFWSFRREVGSRKFRHSQVPTLHVGHTATENNFPNVIHSWRNSSHLNTSILCSNYSNHRTQHGRCLSQKGLGMGNHNHSCKSISIFGLYSEWFNYHA